MALKHLGELIIFLVILWLVWFFMGGAQHAGNDKPFIKPAAPIDTGEKYGPQ